MTNSHYNGSLMSPERFMTLSNIISICRASMAAPIIIFMNRGQMMWVTTFIVLAMVSDALDGFIARKFNTVTVLGKALDPAADKICIFSVILFLYIKNKIPLHFMVVIGVRDFLISIMHLYLVKLKFIVTGANFAGKVSTVMISAALCVHIYDFQAAQVFLIYAAYTFMSISFAQYFILCVKKYDRQM
ncbi:MAG: CDP-alcohol phosphatidyltransferase family protein [Desulfobacteraceae bacterium]|nr:CDP-alcohol phosphatidyltransferase family protein [Desulfobacteraceae bacterium]